MPATRFTPDRREQLLQLLEAGKPVVAAAADVGISRNTIRAWVHRGKESEAPADVREFSSEYRRIVDARPKGQKRFAPVAALKEHQAGRLSEDQLLQLLEEAAQNLNVRAIEILLARQGANSDDNANEKPQSLGDELAAWRERKSGN
jgi:hypothetical protein